MAKSIGNHTGPNKTPKINELEYINPTVTKKAQDTMGRKEKGLLPPPASLYASHIEKKYRQG